MATILDGKALAKSVESDLLARVEALKQKTGRTPILATILVGDDPASATYVRMKGNACRRVGMDSIRVEMPEQTTAKSRAVARWAKAVMTSRACAVTSRATRKSACTGRPIRGARVCW